MERPASRGSRGLTLIEVMISMVILFIVFFGLMETVRVATEFNLRNAVNAEAVRIADNTIGLYRSTPYASLPPSAAAITWQLDRRVRQMNVRFQVQVNPSQPSNLTRTINVTVAPVTPRFSASVRPTSFTTIVRNPEAL